MSSLAAGGCNGRLPSSSPPRMARSTWPAMSYELGNLQLLNLQLLKHQIYACLLIFLFFIPLLGASLEEPLLQLCLCDCITVHRIGQAPILSGNQPQSSGRSTESNVISSGLSFTWHILSGFIFRSQRGIQVDVTAGDHRKGELWGEQIYSGQYIGIQHTVSR